MIYQNNKNVTIYQIAAKAGVSVSTVSRVLTGKARVAPEKKQLVLKIIEEYKYRPNSMARSLSARKSNVLGIILPDIAHPYWSAIFLGAEQRALESGYTLLLGNTLNDNITHITNIESRLLDIMMERQVDGLMIAGGRIHETVPIQVHIDEVIRVSSKIPVISVSGRIAHERCYSVEPDEVKGIDLMVNYLVALRHRKIGLMGGVRGIEPTDMRIRAFIQAMHSHNLEVYPEWFIHTDFDVEGGRIGMERLLQLKEKPDAILCINDNCAIGAIFTAQRSGLRIPDDLSIAGIDNIYLDEYIVPKLTTINLFPRLLGEIAVSTILKLIEGKKPPLHSIVAPELVIRESCKSPLQS